jgi:phospholipase C
MLLLLTIPFVSLSAFAAKNRPAAWDSIEHVVIIVLENTKSSDAIQQKFMGSLAKKWGYLSNYRAVSHPSQPNYIAMVAGNTHGVTGNENVNLSVKHIGNLLHAKGKTWKAYAENYPGNCYKGTRSGDYYRKHLPFISFLNVQTNPKQCSNIVASTEFFNDLTATKNNLPTYSFYVPNIKNDGHDTSIQFADTWLSKTFGLFLSNPAILKNTLFIITFDEDDLSAGNNVYTVFVGAGVKPKSQSNIPYSHYSILKTLEAIFELDSLGRNDATAVDISDIWLAPVTH